MNKLIISSVIVLSSFIGFSQEYQFTSVVDLDCSNVKSQGNTGTCWSYSTSSFLESEIKRITDMDVDLSEMYTVRNTYPKKAWNYVMRQGKAQYSEGGLAHDVLNSVENYGLVPETAFTGLAANDTKHNHSEMIAVTKAMLDAYIKNPARKLSPRWKKSVEAILDIYLGENPKTFTYNGKEYTPKSFQEAVKINPSDYITLTSFSHQPFYNDFVLNIPDNFSNGSMHNVPLDELERIMYTTLKKGYSIELDIDVSEKTFSSKNGIAVIPEDDKTKLEALLGIKKEKEITQEYRQQEFENFTTTDDHLMHITGIAKDQNGTIYYKTKNSWGSDGNRVKYGGYVYISAAYFKLKAISITLNKNAFKLKKRK